jgi:hypothetical protein
MLPGLVLTGELAFQRSAKCQRAKVEVNISNDVAQACAQGIVSYVHPHGCNFAFAIGFALVSSGFLIPGALADEPRPHSKEWSRSPPSVVHNCLPSGVLRSPLAEHDELKRAP